MNLYVRDHHIYWNYYDMIWSLSMMMMTIFFSFLCFIHFILTTIFFLDHRGMKSIWKLIRKKRMLPMSKEKTWLAVQFEIQKKKMLAYHLKYLCARLYLWLASDNIFLETGDDGGAINISSNILSYLLVSKWQIFISIKFDYRS